MKRYFISTTELGELLGVTRQTIRNWFLNGQIKAHKIGKNIKIPIEEAVRLLERYDQPVPIWLKNGSDASKKFTKG